MSKQRRETKRPRKKRAFVLDENIKRFFPPVSRMDGDRSPRWGWGADITPKQKSGRITRQKPT